MALAQTGSGSSSLIENLYGIPFNRLFMVLQSCKELRYRDFDLLTGISDHIASMLDSWTTKQVLQQATEATLFVKHLVCRAFMFFPHVSTQVVLFLSVLENLAFYPAALMEAFAEKVIANPDALTLKDLFCVLKVYSSLNYDVQHQRQQ